MFALGGLQAFVGWIMVKSGLHESTAHISGDSVHVSPYRLTIHLTLAVIIYLYVIWTALQLGFPKSSVIFDISIKKLRKVSWIVTSLIVITIISGGFVAGTKAGMVYQSFPLMNGYLIPPDYFSLEPFFMNITENMSAVQFNHRLLAFATLFVILYFIVKSMQYPLPKLKKQLIYILLGVVIFQITLGVATLVHFVPKKPSTVIMGTAHQGVAMILLTISFILNYRFQLK